MLKKSVVIVAGILVAGVANAQGFYAGASLGQGKARFSNGFSAESVSDDFYGAPGQVSGSMGKTKTAWKLMLGYQFNNNFAVEGSYANLGKFKGSYAGVGAAAGDAGNVSYKVDAWTIAGVGTLPVSQQFSAFGKLGIAATKARNTGNVDLPSIAVTDSWSESKSRTRVMYGVGVKYNIAKDIGIRAEYEDFGRVGSDDTTLTARMNMISVGMDFRF